MMIKIIDGEILDVKENIENLLSKIEIANN